MRRNHVLAALVALSAAAAFGGAYAASDSANDALPVLDAKVGLAQAVVAAEHHEGGKASRAEFERHDGKWVFDVEVVRGNAVRDVKVDAKTGKVVAASPDAIDRDDAADRPD